jgi:hypothetical protein
MVFVDLLKPDSRQLRPTPAEIKGMVKDIVVSPIVLPVKPFTEFLSRLREDRSEGGAYLVAFEIGPDSTFDWFASRNRLSEMLNEFVTHRVIRESLPELQIPDSLPIPATCNSGFLLFDQFLLQGTLASVLYNGGAYAGRRGDGRAEDQFALEVCEAMFGPRYGEILCNPNYDRWAPWFWGVAWDVTIVVFDRRTRRLWILAVTDSD